MTDIRTIDDTDPHILYHGDWTSSGNPCKLVFTTSELSERKHHSPHSFPLVDSLIELTC
jgi:hypothetical protein